MQPRYLISYNKTEYAVSVHPDNKSGGSNFHEIGEFRPELDADFEEYEAELSEAVRQALGTVGEDDPTIFSLRVHDIKTGEISNQPATNDPPAPLPMEDQVPVSEDTTAAEAMLKEDGTYPPEEE